MNIALQNFVIHAPTSRPNFQCGVTRGPLHGHGKSLATIIHILSAIFVYSYRSISYVVRNTDLISPQPLFRNWFALKSPKALHIFNLFFCLFRQPSIGIRTDSDPKMQMF